MNKKSKIMRILLALSSLVCTNAFAAPGAQSLVLQKGFGAAGDFVFTTIAGLHSTCELKANDTALTIYACLNPPGNDCSVIDNIISTPNVGDFTLVAGSTYHLSAIPVKQVSNGYNTLYGSYPNRIQIGRMFCSNASSTATLSSFGMYNAFCNGTGCATISGPITVTFP